MEIYGESVTAMSILGP
uniref:Uncharacterized protein n=1 Tax=Anguilla anguilla TaxID=7936 RepID=A0A0E9SZS6_ANGAN